MHVSEFEKITEKPFSKVVYSYIGNLLSGNYMGFAITEAYIIAENPVVVGSGSTGQNPNRLPLNYLYIKDNDIILWGMFPKQFWNSIPKGFAYYKVAIINDDYIVQYKRFYYLGPFL
jgi:hypothetical protein